jgi:hypothetical protein
MSSLAMAIFSIPVEARTMNINLQTEQVDKIPAGWNYGELVRCMKDGLKRTVCLPPIHNKSTAQMNLVISVLVDVSTDPASTMIDELFFTDLITNCPN